MTRAEMSGRFDIDRETYNAMIEQAREDFPFEVCGLLAGTEGIVCRRYPIRNAARSMTFYNMDPKGMLAAFNDMEDVGFDLMGIYHSHTHTEAFPSQTDVELAFYPDVVYLIVSLQVPDKPVIRAFDILDGKITERDLRVGGVQLPSGPR